MAGISFKDKDGIQIMKDYMNSGSLTRGKSEIAAYALMVFVGNIDNVEGLLKISHLLAPFPEAMIDSAFFDRFHAYIPGWEVPKLKPENFTDQYGLITDYMAEAWREMRKQSFGDAVTKYFRLGRELSQRDTRAVTKSVSGFLKLLAPHGEYDKGLGHIHVDRFCKTHGDSHVGDRQELGMAADRSDTVGLGEDVRPRARSGWRSVRRRRKHGVGPG